MHGLLLNLVCNLGQILDERVVNLFFMATEFLNNIFEILEAFLHTLFEIGNTDHVHFSRADH